MPTIAGYSVTAAVFCPIYGAVSYTYTLYSAFDKSIILWCYGDYVGKVWCYDSSGVELAPECIRIKYTTHGTRIIISANACIVRVIGRNYFLPINDEVDDEAEKLECFEKEDHLSLILDYHEKSLDDTTPSREAFKTMRQCVVKLINELLIEHNYKLTNIVERFLTNMIPSEFVTDFNVEVNTIHVYICLHCNTTNELQDFKFTFTPFELSISKLIPSEITKQVKSGKKIYEISYCFS
jgi:hypothetical protein